MSVVPKVTQGNGHWSLLFWRCHHLPPGVNKPLFLKKIELMHRLGGPLSLNHGRVALGCRHGVHTKGGPSSCTSLKVASWMDTPTGIVLQ